MKGFFILITLFLTRLCGLCSKVNANLITDCLISLAVLVIPGNQLQVIAIIHLFFLQTRTSAERDESPSAVTNEEDAWCVL